MYPSENIQSCHTEHCKRQLVQNTDTAWASKHINHSTMSNICVKPSVCSYRRFSRLLLKSFIMSERKSLLTSISSELGEEFFRRVATTFKITEWRTISVMRKEGWKPEMGAEFAWTMPEWEHEVGVFLLTGVLDLDSGVRLRVGLVNHLRTDLLCQNLHRWEGIKNC